MSRVSKEQIDNSPDIDVTNTHRWASLTQNLSS
jgi:hypothetical protein